MTVRRLRDIWSYLASDDALGQVSGIALGFGFSGVALTLAHCERLGSEPRATIRAAEVLERAMADAEEEPQVRTFHKGLGGLAFAVARVHGLQHPFIDAVDEAITDSLAEVEAGEHPGMYNGLAGCGYYGIQRKEKGREIVIRAVNGLRSVAVEDSTGIYWSVRDHCGAYPLGLAHGHFGILLFLAQAYRAYPEDLQVALTMVWAGLGWVRALVNTSCLRPGPNDDMIVGGARLLGSGWSTGYAGLMLCCDGVREAIGLRRDDRMFTQMLSEFASLSNKIPRPEIAWGLSSGWETARLTQRRSGFLDHVPEVASRGPHVRPWPESLVDSKAGMLEGLSGLVLRNLARLDAGARVDLHTILCF